MSIWLPTLRAGSGADVFVIRLADELRRRGLDVNISWFPHWYEFAPWLMSRVVPPAGTTIIHANSAYAFAFSKWGLPLVATEYHYVLDPAYRPFKSMMQAAYHACWIGPGLQASFRAASAVTTISQFTEGVLRRQLPGVDAKVIPCWVDYAVFKPADTTAPRSGRPFRLFFVGNASRRKGGDVIVELAKRLGSDFEIVCTSGLRRDKSAVLADNVRILGRLSEEALVAAYQDCDAVLVPSRYEGFGYSALEAMACAKPVVGFRCGAIEEVVEEGTTALLADIDDLAGLESHCRRLAADPLLCADMGMAGRSRALTQFTSDKAVDAFVHLYASLPTANDRGRAMAS